MAYEKITGLKEVDKRLKRLALKDAKRIGRQAINKGMTPVVKGLRNKTPKGPDQWRKTKSGERYLRKGGTLKKSVGKRNKKNRRKGIQEAKVGYNVGLKHRKMKPGAKTRPKRRAYHAPLFTLGTGRRIQKKTGRRTGRMPTNKIVRRVYSSTANNSKQTMIKAIAEGIEKAAAKK